MLRSIIIAGLTLAVVLATGAEVNAQSVGGYGRAPRLPKEPTPPGNIGIEQKQGATIPLDLIFHDHDGRETRLGDCIGGKPTILVLAYYSCPKLCTEVLNGLVGEMKALTRIGLKAGRDYNVVTVSINPLESTKIARMKRQSYLNEYDKRPETEAGWWFLTASHDQGTNVVDAAAKVKNLADAVGFKFAADNQKAYDEASALMATDPAKAAILHEKAVRKTKDFVHDSAVMVLTSNGTISQYHLGLAPTSYNAEDLRASMTAAADGKLGSKYTRAAMLCFAYDVHSGTYEPVMLGMGIVAGLFVLLLSGLVYVTIRKARREKPLTAADAVALKVLPVPYPPCGEGLGRGGSGLDPHAVESLFGGQS